MKKQRQGWATRKLPPETVEEWDRHLDTIAATMAVLSRREAELCLPAYKLCKFYRDQLVDKERLLADARQRLDRAGVAHRF